MTPKKRDHHFLTQAQCDRIRRLCELHPALAVSQIVGVNPNAITHLKRRGWKAYTQTHRERPMPHDFPLIAGGMTIMELRAHYGASQKVVYRWCRQIGREPLKGMGGGKPMPRPERDELDRVCQEIGPIAAARHFGVHRNTLQKWREEYGLPIAERFVRRRRAIAAHAARIGWVERYVAERVAA